MPCTTSSFTLMQTSPGNPYTIGGEDRAPCSASTREPISQSSSVVTPARTCAAIARNAFPTIIPQVRNFSNCSGLLIDIETQWQPHPPPQQLPPPPEKPPEDLAEAPLFDPFAALKTES